MRSRGWRSNKDGAVPQVNFASFKENGERTGVGERHVWGQLQTDRSDMAPRSATFESFESHGFIYKRKKIQKHTQEKYRT